MHALCMKELLFMEGLPEVYGKVGLKNKAH